MEQKNDYASKFDGAIIVAMSTLIILAIAGVIWLHKATDPECKPSEYTYCEAPAHH